MTKRSAKGHILKLENNPHTLDFLGDAIKARGYSLRRADTMRKAIKTIEQDLPDLVVIVDHPERGVDARYFMELQHSHPDPRLVNIPIVILVDTSKMKDFAGQAIPGRVVVLQLPINLRALEQKMQELLWPWGNISPD